MQLVPLCHLMKILLEHVSFTVGRHESVDGSGSTAVAIKGLPWSFPAMHKGRGSS